MTVAAVDPALLIAGAGVVVGVVAIVAQWQRFRPRFEARLDERRQAIRLDIANKGRAPGWISRVAVIDNRDDELSTEFADFDGGAFVRTKLEANDGMEWTLKSRPSQGAFPTDVRVVVYWSRLRKRVLVPEHTKGISYYD